MDVDGEHRDAVRARVAHELRRRVEAHRLAVEERAAERGGLVPLEPGRDVDEQGEARGVGLRKSVIAEAEDLLEHLAREALVIAARPHALDQALLERAEPPFRFQAAIARRSASASPGVNPAATIASCITCSWKIGTPSVRLSTPSTSGPG